MSKLINFRFLQIVIFILLFFITLLLRIPTFFEPYWYGDEGVTITVAQRLFAGETIYSDVFDNKPPLLYVLFGLAKNLFWVKVLMAIWILATLTIVWLFAQKIAKKIGKENNLLYPFFASVLFIYLAATPALEGNIANGEIFFILPITAAMYIVFESIYKRVTSWEWFLVGFLFAIASLLKIPAITDLAAVGLFILFIVFVEKRKGLLKGLSFLGLGFTLVWLITFAAFMLWGNFVAFYQAVFSSNIGYLEPGNQLIIPQGKLILKFLISLVLVSIILTFRKKLGYEKIFLYLWLIFAFFGTQLSGRAYTHYLIQAVVPFSLATFLFLLRFKISQIFESLIVIILFVIGSYYSTFQLQRNSEYYQNFLFLLFRQKSYQAYQTWFDPRTERLDFLTNYLANNSNPGDRLFIWGNEPDLYYLSKLAPATPYLTAYHVLSTPCAKKTTLKTLSQSKPKFIVTISNISEKLPRLSPIIEEDYQEKVTFKKATIWRLKNN